MGKNHRTHPCTFEWKNSNAFVVIGSMYITCFLVPYPLFLSNLPLNLCSFSSSSLLLLLFLLLLAVLHQHKPSEVVNCTWMSASLRNSTCDKVGRRLFNWHMRKEKKCIEKETKKRITANTYVQHLTHAQCTHCTHTVMYLIYFVLVDNDFTMYCHSTINSVSFSHLFEHWMCSRISLCN